MDLKAFILVATKSQSLTEAIVVKGILFRPGHPGHSAGRVIMKEHAAMELTNKSWAVFSSSGANSGRQAHKIQQPHLLQSINHKSVIHGSIHEKLIFVDSPGLHKC